MSNYISFHNHDTLGSILDSTLKVEDLVKWAKANNMSAVGVQNHGNVTSALKLYKLCKEHEIKPLLGLEAYLTKNDLDQEGKKYRDNHHIGLIAKNLKGWHNIIKLHNLSWREDRYYYDPRITIEDLREYKDGIIVTSACIGGFLGKLYLEGNTSEAEQRLVVFKDLFKDDFYLELQDHNSTNPEDKEKQVDYNKWLISMSKKYGVKCIIQQDAHYYCKEDWEGHLCLLCKNTFSKITEPKFQFDSHEYYCKNEQEMVDTFADYPLSFIQECINNTKEIADKVEHFDITNQNYTMPTFGTKEEVCKKLRELIQDGYINRFGKDFVNKEYEDRIAYELETIESLNMQDYVLMVYDLFKYARENGIYTPIGRGSAGASLVLYCLNVVQLDPIKYNLIFDRFCSRDRVSMMDIDSDFSPEDKPKIEKYLSDKYGKDKVCGISTYMELTAKSALKAVCSVLDIPFALANSISPLIDTSMSLEENYNNNPEFTNTINNDDLLKRAYKLALVIEGTYSSRSQHACASVIFPKNMDELCPCVTVKSPDGKTRSTVTTFSMTEIDGDLKFLKLDILALRNIEIIRETDKLIYQRHGITMDFHNIPYDDRETYKVLEKGENVGVFQFESSMFRSLLKEVKPRCLEDIAVITAIGRPSALQSGLTEQYKKIRRGEQSPEYLVPELEPALKDTYGLYIFQETMMMMCKIYAGFTNQEADMARKICGKKLKDKLPMLEKMFIDGAVKMGRDQEQAKEEFEKIKQFASYGFAKIHSVSYGAMSYITAYYKTHYPLEYFTAMLNTVADDTDKVGLYINECLRLGIDVLPPDINQSIDKFSIDQDGKIRFGFNAIKGLGQSAITSLLKARKTGFKSIEDFIRRTPKVTKSGIQALLKVGAFSAICAQPKKWESLVDYLVDIKKDNIYPKDIELAVYDRMAEKQYKKDLGYTRLVEEKRGLKTSKADQERKKEINTKLADIKQKYYQKIYQDFSTYDDYTMGELQRNELELLGFNITSHPYKRWYKFEPLFKTNNDKNKLEYIPLNEAHDIASLLYDGNTAFHTVALVSNIKVIKTKRTKEEMAILTLEYFNTKISCTLFPKEWDYIKNDVNICDMFSIVARIEESYSYGKTQEVERYVLKAFSMRKLNVLNNKANKMILQVDDNTINNIVETIKRVSYRERENWLPINKAVFLQRNGKFIPLSGLAWVNNSENVIKNLS